MTLILILSGATYNFEIRFVAMHDSLLTTVYRTENILSVERSVCWRVGPKSVGPIICPRRYSPPTQLVIVIVIVIEALLCIFEIIFDVYMPFFIQWSAKYNTYKSSCCL